jgi:hypothetical protein
MTVPAPNGGLSFREIGEQLGRSERWAARAVQAAERRENAKAASLGAIHFDGSILALRRFTSSELLDAGFNISMVAQRQGHGTQDLARLAIAAGLTALAASTLATLHPFFKYASAAANHRNEGAAYGALRRQFDAFMLLLPTSDRAALLADLDRSRVEIDRLGRDTPLIPARSYTAAGKGTSE